MLIYLYGLNSYSRQEKARWYVKQFKEKHSGLSIEKFSLDEAGDLAKLKDFTAAQSLFSKTKLCIVQNVAAADPKEIAPILKSVLDDKGITLIISEDKKLPKDFDFLSKAFKAQEFDKPTEAELIAFIKKEAEKRNLKLPAPIVDSLIRANSSDNWGIINDLDKLELGGHLEDFLAIPNFFALISRVKRGDLAALTWLLENEEPAKIFNMLASVSHDNIKNFADYDAAIKSGKLEYEEALLDLVISH